MHIKFAISLALIPVLAHAAERLPVREQQQVSHPFGAIGQERASATLNASLFHAARTGDADSYYSLIERGANRSAEDANGLLYAACEGGCPEIVKDAFDSDVLRQIKACHDSMENLMHKVSVGDCSTVYVESEMFHKMHSLRELKIQHFGRAFEVANTKGHLDIVEYFKSVVKMPTDTERYNRDYDLCFGTLCRRGLVAASVMGCALTGMNCMISKASMDYQYGLRNSGRWFEELLDRQAAFSSSVACASLSDD